MRLLPWDEERDAAIVMTMILGGWVEPRDPGGGSIQLHDFDLHLDDGCTIAVEVTRHSAPGYLSQRGAVDKKDWTTPDLTWDWHVGMAATFDVNRLRASVVEPLSALEAVGIETVGLRDPIEDGPAWAARVALHRLGVRNAYRLGEATGGRATIDVGEVSVGGSTSFEVVGGVATEHAGKDDNRAKLAAATAADERHLFIWVENSAHQVTAAMDMEIPFTLPEAAPPVLPLYVDRVWLATAYTRSRVWSYDCGDGWQHHGVFEPQPEAT